MKRFVTALTLLLLTVCGMAAEPAPTKRIPSPDGKFTALAASNHISVTDIRGRVLLSDDYRKRDYQPERGRWTRSGRFFVYPIVSSGGHSPWHRNFVIADTLTRRTYTDSDLRVGDAVTGFKLSGDDTISYEVLDRSKEDWDNGIPGIPRQFSIAARIAKLGPAK